jgi:hypothetical protein
MSENPLCNIWHTTDSYSAIALTPPGLQTARQRSGKAQGLAGASKPPLLTLLATRAGRSSGGAARAPELFRGTDTWRATESLAQSQFAQIRFEQFSIQAV